jgi:hypothetical protein
MINRTTPEPIVLRAINATAPQTISTQIVASAKYTLDVDLGFEKFDYDEASVFLIVDGHQVKATPLASYRLTQTQMQKTGNWYDFEASYTATSADPHGSIKILLSSLTSGKGYGFFRRCATRPIDRAGAGPTRHAGARDLGDDAARLRRSRVRGLSSGNEGLRDHEEADSGRPALVAGARLPDTRPEG